MRFTFAPPPAPGRSMKSSFIWFVATLPIYGQVSITSLPPSSVCANSALEIIAAFSLKPPPANLLSLTPR